MERFMFSDSRPHLLRLSTAMLIALMAAPVSGLAVMSSGVSGMEALSDDMLGEITGQDGSLFLVDHIRPNELERAPLDGSANFDFYRMGMDVKLSLNLNVSKFQLGCGGVNDLLVGLNGPGCDLDIDYLGFMGINAQGDRPAYNLANSDVNGKWGPESAFELIRPYIELAIKNDNSRTQREVVGLKLGAELINGAIRMGRDYLGVGYNNPEVPASGGINRESGAFCDPSATSGAGVVGCHSGLNSISGYLAGLELSAGFRAGMWFTVLGTGPYNAEVAGCIGRIAYSPCRATDVPFFVDAGGTRMNELFVHAAKLNLDEVPLLGNVEGFGGLVLDTRQIHYLLTPNSSGFYLSLQRESVSWPNYSKKAPIRDYDSWITGSCTSGNNCFFGSQYNLAALPDDRNGCNPKYAQVSPACGSGYAARANTGWWLSAANAKMLDLRPKETIWVNNRSNPMTLTQILGALNANNSNFVIDNPRLDFVAARNCYGTAMFC
jgi:hypothetical protein